MSRAAIILAFNQEHPTPNAYGVAKKLFPTPLRDCDSHNFEGQYLLPIFAFKPFCIRICHDSRVEETLVPTVAPVTS